MQVRPGAYPRRIHPNIPRLEMLARDKRSSLFGRFKEEMFYNVDLRSLNGGTGVGAQVAILKVKKKHSD